MKKKQRTPQSNVKKFMRGGRSIKATNVDNLADRIVGQYGGSKKITVACLNKEIRGGNLFKKRDLEGDTEYVPKRVSNRRAKHEREIAKAELRTAKRESAFV